MSSLSINMGMLPFTGSTLSLEVLAEADQVLELSLLFQATSNARAKAS